MAYKLFKNSISHLLCCTANGLKICYSAEQMPKNKLFSRANGLLFAMLYSKWKLYAILGQHINNFRHVTYGLTCYIYPKIQVYPQVTKQVHI